MATEVINKKSKTQTPKPPRAESAPKGEAKAPRALAERVAPLLEANYAFMDGHVETIAYSDTWKPIGPNPLGVPNAQNHKTMWQVAGWTAGLPQQN